VKVVLFAVASPFAAEMLETLRRLGWQVAACVRNLPGAVASELPGVIDAEHLDEALIALAFAVPLTTPGHRHAATADARSRGFTTQATIVDPTAVIADSATLGEGTYVNAGAIVSAAVRTGTSCSVNRGASIGHHNVIADYVSIGPGVVTGGGCRIKRGAFLGVGAVLAPEVTIGANSVVGAGAVVLGEVPEGAVVVGNPARVLREGPGYGGVGVPSASSL
jgi:sugar O-acyltransferase (sialic acid O-acetyltransferase NeuD family)